MSRKLLRLPIIALAFFLFASLRAENAAPSADSPVAPTFDFDFPGGTLPDLAAALGKAGLSISAVGSDEGLKLPLKPFSLRHVAPVSVANVVRELIEPEFDAQRLRFSCQQASPTTAVFIVSPRTSRRPDHLTRSLFAGNVLDRYSIDDVVDAIRTAWAFDPAHNPDDLKLKFHPGTKLLLISGPPEAVDVASSIMGSLREAAAREERRAPKTPSSPRAPAAPAEPKAQP